MPRNPGVRIKREVLRKIKEKAKREMTLQHFFNSRLGYGKDGGPNGIEKFRYWTNCGRIPESEINNFIEKFDVDPRS